MRHLYLLAAVLMLTACAPSKTLLTPRIVPPLDRSLAEQCPAIPDPPSDPGDYDAWQLWVQNEVLVRYGVCAARHRETVLAWPG